MIHTGEFFVLEGEAGTEQEQTLLIFCHARQSGQDLPFSKVRSQVERTVEAKTYDAYIQRLINEATIINRL